MSPSKQPSEADKASDGLRAAEAETLRTALQEALSATDGVSADLEARLLTIQRRLRAAVSKDSTVPQPEKPESPGD